VSLINSSEDELATSAGVGVSVQPESEGGLGDQVLSNHVVENGDNIVDRDGLESKTKDTIELSKHEGESRLVSGLSENLVSHLESRDGDGILGEETAHLSRTILNLEVSSIGNVGRALVRVVLVVEVAWDHNKAALGTGDPQVAGSSVKHNQEILSWGSDGDGSVVLGIIHVADGDISGVGGEHASSVVSIASHPRGGGSIFGNGNFNEFGTSHKGKE